MYIYLHKKLDDNFDVIASLEAKIEELTTDRERLEATAARELSTANRNADQQISSLQQQVEELTDRLEGLTEFKEKKDEIEARLAKCLADLDEERALRQSQVAELERRNVAAKDKLKKEMFLKIKETKQVRNACCGGGGRGWASAGRHCVCARAWGRVSFAGACHVPTELTSRRTSLSPPTTSLTQRPNAPWQKTSK